MAVGDVLGVVNVEEIRVQDRLDDAGNHRDRVVELGHLEEVAVDPVGDVQRPVRTQREQVVCRDRFRLAGSLQHEELGQNGD